MTRIYTTALINKPVEEVFEFVTSPGSWPQWHPSSLGVRGVTGRSMQIGEQCIEEFEVAGRKGSAVWTTREHQAPRRWVIDGKIVGRESGGTVSYRLTSQEGGTFFEREFVYPTASLLFKLLDRLVVRRRVQAESEEAMRRLKKVLESHSSKVAK